MQLTVKWPLSAEPSIPSSKGGKGEDEEDEGGGAPLAGGGGLSSRFTRSTSWSDAQRDALHHKITSDRGKLRPFVIATLSSLNTRTKYSQERTARKLAILHRPF